jgi:cytochrome P450
VLVADGARVEPDHAVATFREHGLQGATIAVTLHQERDIVLAVPLIFPGQLCALAPTSPQPEVSVRSSSRSSASTTTSRVYWRSAGDEPGDDLVSALMQAETDVRRMTHKEALDF